MLGEILIGVASNIIIAMLGGMWTLWKILLVVKKGLQASLRRDLTNDALLYIENGWIPLDVKDIMLQTYEAYHALGANGSIDGLMEQVKALPNVPVKGDKHARKD